MALSLSLGEGELPPVVIAIPGTDLPAGQPWSLSASAGAFTWHVRGSSGTGTAEQVVLADPLAPVNELLTYRLTVSGTVTQTGTITRAATFAGGDGFAGDAFASLDASSVAAVRRTGGDSRSGERRFHASTVRGSAFSPLRLEPVAGAGGGSMSFASVGADTETMRSLLDGNGLLVAYHDRTRCGVPGCPVRPATVLYVTDESSDLGAQWDVGEVAWSISYLLQPVPEPDTVSPVQDFDDFDAAALTFAQLDALALTWDTFDRTIWSEVGG